MGPAKSSSTEEDTSGPTAMAKESDKPRVTLTEGQSGLYPQFILFGDSITQNLSSTVQSRLQTSYTRRADIVNRGFSGYTTTLALTTLRYILPISLLDLYQPQPPIRLLTIFFGANDACLPENAQHVPLDLYLSNIRQIIDYPVFQRDRTKVILITPPPINEWQLTRPLTRTATRAKKYARAIRKLAEELQLPCLDLWTRFMNLAGYNIPLYAGLEASDNLTLEESHADREQTSTADRPETSSQCSLPGSLSCPPNKILPELLLDGLHVSAHGYDILYNELTQLIQTEIPECAPENMPMVLQDWKIVLDVQKPNTDAQALPESAMEVEKQDAKDVDSTVEADAASESWTEVTSANMEDG